MTRVRGGAAAEDRLRDALTTIDELFQEIDREAVRNPLLAKDCVIDGRAVIRETLEFVGTELNKILARRDQAADDDLRGRIEALEAWRKQIEAGDRQPIPLRKQG